MIDEAGLATLEAAVGRALAGGDAGDLRVLGWGEISLVLGWPVDAPRWACKRLPVFPTPGAAHAYTATLDRYITVLRTRGVDVVDTDVRTVELDHGAVALYCVQPVLPAGSLAVDVVRAGSDRASAVIGKIVDTVGAVVDESVGFDAQLSNWALTAGGELSYFDVTTPLLREADGSPVLDSAVFLASLPWPLRAPVRRWLLPAIIQRYHEPRSVVLDLAANLCKERLEPWIPAVIAAAGDCFDPPLTEAEVRRDYRSDARTWSALQALRRADRAWQRNVRRRPYPFLLPGRIER